MGIAVTAADTSRGLWWFSTNGGTTWQKVAGDGGASLSVHNALELLPDANTYLYFQPTTSATGGGTVTGALTFRAWDGDALTGANFTAGTLHDIDPDNNTALFGTGTNNAMEESYSATADTVTLMVEGPPQVVTSSGGATFTEPNNAPGLGATAAAAVQVVVDGGITVANPDPTVAVPTLSSATVQITGNYKSAEDVLSFTNTSAGAMGNIAAAWDPGSGTLTLTSAGGTASLAQWQTALRAVSYYETGELPANPEASRTVTFIVHDTSGVLHDSAPATHTVKVVQVDDLPILAAETPTLGVTWSVQRLLPAAFPPAPYSWQR